MPADVLAHRGDRRRWCRSAHGRRPTGGRRWRCGAMKALVVLGRRRRRAGPRARQRNAQLARLRRYGARLRHVSPPRLARCSRLRRARHARRLDERLAARDLGLCLVLLSGELLEPPCRALAARERERPLLDRGTTTAGREKELVLGLEKFSSLVHVRLRPSRAAVVGGRGRGRACRSSCTPARCPAAALRMRPGRPRGPPDQHSGAERSAGTPLLEPEGR